MFKTCLPRHVALITGINGQDGCYLTRLLLSKGYEVHGLTRQSKEFSILNFKNFLPDYKLHSSRLFFHHGDILDGAFVSNVIDSIKPNEIYNFASQSNVRLSVDLPTETFQINVLGATNILEAVLRYSPKTRVLQAGSSELFAGGELSPQNENTPIKPLNPYGISKALSFWTTKCYRETYGLFACNSVSFNHESPVRPASFITRKVVLALCRIKTGLQKEISVGNLYATRDWGHADDVVRGQWLMLNHSVPDDFVFGTGISRTVKEMISEVAFCLGMRLDWVGSGIQETGIWKNGNGKPIIRVSERFFREENGAALVACSKKASEELKWTPKVSFRQMLTEMVAADNSTLEEQKD